MLLFLIFVSFFATVIITFCAAFSFKSKISKVVCILVVLILLISGGVFTSIDEKATAESEILNIEFSEIYQNNDGEYFVKLTNKNEFTKIYTTEVFKGDSNYLICYHRPNITKSHEFLLDKEKTDYVIVVKDLNIPILSTID